MSLATNIADLATRVATEAKGLRTLVNGNAADLSALTTTAKGNLVLAINELQAEIGAAGAQIDDVTTATSTVWSSSKTNTQINTAVSALVAAAPGTLDTLNELAAALGDDPNFATTITGLLAGKAPIVHGHALTDANITGILPAAQLPAATDIAKGAVELATTTETTTGTDTTRAVTPAGVKAVGDTKAPLSHTHTAAQISDSSSFGRAVVTAASAAAARTAIGAGTSSLAIGTTAGTAADAALVGSTTTDFVATFEAGLV